MKASLNDAGDGEVGVITEIDDLVVQEQMESMLWLSLLKPGLHCRIAAKIAEQENDCEDATEDLEETKKFLADLEVNCEHTTKRIGRVGQS